MCTLHCRVFASSQEQEAVIGIRDAVGATHDPPGIVALKGAVLSWGRKRDVVRVGSDEGQVKTIRNKHESKANCKEDIKQEEKRRKSTN